MRTIRQISLFLLLLAADSRWAEACGISFAEPRSWFQNVDFQGHVHVVETLKSFDLVPSKRLPLFLIFNSGYAASPYAGALQIPLLESRIAQIDEDTFLCVSPSGWLLPFRRSPRDKSVLNGPEGMLGSIRGDNISLWTDCGDRLTYENGKISKMQIKGTTLLYVYAGKFVSEIKRNDISLLRVIYDPATERMKGISMEGNQVISFQWGERPLVQQIAGQRLVGGLEQTVTKVMLPDGSVKTFDFGITESVNPKLKINGATELVWNPENKMIVSDGTWKFEIQPGLGRFDNAAISRRNERGDTELWHEDSARGLRITRSADGGEKKSSFHTSGTLRGRVRSVETRSTSGEARQTLYSYDEHGRCIRIKSNMDETEYVYADESENSPFYTVHDYERVHEANLKATMKNRSATVEAREQATFALATLYLEQGRQDTHVLELIKSLRAQDMADELRNLLRKN